MFPSTTAPAAATAVVPPSTSLSVVPAVSVAPSITTTATERQARDTAAVAARITVSELVSWSSRVSFWV